MSNVIQIPVREDWDSTEKWRGKVQAWRRRKGWLFDAALRQQREREMEELAEREEQIALYRAALGE